MEEGTPDPGLPAAELDLARLLEISGGEAEFEREIVAEYMEQAWSLFDGATRALAAKDAAELRRTAHTIKGSSRTVGAEGMAAAAAALESAATTSTRGTPPLLGRVYACLVATEREFERYFRESRRRDAA